MWRLEAQYWPNSGIYRGRAQPTAVEQEEVNPVKQFENKKPESKKQSKPERSNTQKMMLKKPPWT